jgi:hypothetical protein
MSALAILALAVPALVSTAVQAQVQQAQIVRPIPLKSLRGELVFGPPPDVLLNGQPVRLAPGARIKDVNNMLVMSAGLVGTKLIANYTVDTYGLLDGVWLLRDDEIAQPWPKTPQEAAKWSYDPVAHVWVKP